MQHLPLIKTLPVGGQEIVLAEVASSAIPMAATQLVLLAVAYSVTFGLPDMLFDSSIRIAILLSAPFAVVSLNGALVTIQNAIAVLFPAWVRLGPVVSTGVEALGQNVIASVANLIALAIALIVPVGVAWLFVIYLRERGAVGLALIMILSSIILAAETYAAMGFLGRALERAEPLQTT
jgi:hypothetical protein